MMVVVRNRFYTLGLEKWHKTNSASFTISQPIPRYRDRLLVKQKAIISHMYIIFTMCICIVIKISMFITYRMVCPNLRTIHETHSYQRHT